MKKLLLLVVGLTLLTTFVSAENDDFVITRDKSRTVGDRYAQLQNTGVLVGTNKTEVVLTAAATTIPADIHKIYFTAHTATALLGIYNTASGATIAAANCVFEIYEADTGCGHYIDFGDDPIKVTAGMTIVLDDAYCVIHYRQL